jgi:3-oxoacyl-[acyl-carrier-protein] synthase-3
MPDVFIDNLSVSLGDRVFSVDESVAQGRVISGTAELVDSGFHLHHVASSGVSSYTLARDAVRPIGERLKNVGAIVYSTCIPSNANLGNAEEFKDTRDVKHLMSYAASHLQADFGLSHAQVFGISQQACTGMIGALRLGQMLINGEPEIEQVLCLTSDRFPEGAIYEQAYNLISDGAAACTVSRVHGRYKMIAAHAITNGAMAEASDEEAMGSFFSYSHQVITIALQKARLSISDIDWVSAQNTNSKAWQILSRLLKLEYNKVFYGTQRDIGHMISGDNIANLLRLEQEGAVKPGQKILLLMAGLGLNWQCLILERTDVLAQ